MKAVIVTGAREALNRDWHDAIYAALGDRIAEEPAPHVLIHGDGRGIDQLAAAIGREIGWRVVPMPAPWSTMGRAAGPFRNMQMANALLALGACGYEIAVLAFHDDVEHSSKGTLNMVNRAKFARIPWSVTDRNGTRYGGSDG